jgi:CubicO group peptidase (beta-lactamase class C family)
MHAIFLLSLACSTPDLIWEGRNPGECTDEADNDGDGTFDCHDTDCFGAPGCIAAAANGAWSELLDDVQQAVDRGAAEGIALAVVVDGEVAFADAIGDAWEGAVVPLSVDTRMRWNSVSKMHTAIGILRLEEDGVLDLDAPVTDWLTKITVPSPYSADDFTLHRLMTHTSALPDHWTTNCTTELGEYWVGNTESLLAEPGTLYNYSNTGWSLAGRLLEKAYGVDYMEAMEELVLKPAGMTSATFDVSTSLEEPYTIGYDAGTFYTPDLHDCPYLRPAGWLHASVLDLGQMIELQLNGGKGVLSEAGLLAMRAQQRTFSANDTQVGYGLFSWDHAGVALMGHGGAGGGHRSYVLMAPEYNFGVAVAANDRDFNTYRIAMRAAELFLELPDESPEEFLDDPTTWTAYEGTYEDEINMGTMQVHIGNNGKLYLRFDDGSDEDLHLYQSGRSEFFYLSSGWNYVRFVPGESGDIRYLANRYFVGERGGANPPPPQTPEQVMLWETKSAFDEPRQGGEPHY